MFFPKSTVNAVDVGPWGGLGGGSWEVNGDIRKILICYGDVVDSLMVTYIEHGVAETSLKFGGPGGEKKDAVNIDLY